MRTLTIEHNALEDMMLWSRQQPKMLKRILDLMSNTLSTPFEGIGKPEPLKGALQGFWSRRIDEEHRMVYTVSDTDVTIASCRSHYNF